MAGVETTPAAALAGFVKLPRALFLEPWTRRPACLALFVHLLARANVEPKDWEGLRIERGQLVTSRRSLAAETGITEKSIRCALQELERSGRAHQRAHPRAQAGAHKWARGFTLVTISNFDTYSGSFEEQGPQPGPQESAARAHKRATTKENIKNSREDIKKSISDLEENPSLVEVFLDWLEYRQEIKKPYKSKRSLAAALDELRKISDGNIDTAREIVRRSIANGWQGLFPLKDGGSGRPTLPRSTAADRIRIDKNDSFKSTF